MLRENRVTQIHGTDCQVAQDGWPSMRYFNKDTGYGGQLYQQVTNKRICTELSMTHDDEEYYYMRKYVNEFSTRPSGNDEL